MSIRHPRTRLVTFRLSEEEYMQLTELSGHWGGRSLSEFLRWSVHWIIDNGSRDVLEVMGFSASGQVRLRGPRLERNNHEHKEQGD